MTNDLPSLQTVAVTIEKAVARVTLNRPDVKNAMSFQMVRDLQRAFDALRENGDVRAIVLSGAGGTFCAGGDVNELRETIHANDPNADKAQAANFDGLLHSVNQAPQVVIAQVDGAAMGGGLGLVCVSDIAIASTTAIFGFPEVRLGLVPSFISPYAIQRLGLTRARELMLTGRRFSGSEARENGLVHDVCPPDKLEETVSGVVSNVLKGGPRALAACKALIFEVLDKPLDATLDYRAALLNRLRQGEEGHEGMMAFLMKRPAKWTE
jgi:enoyl-CoA hydratase/carnithine racemase